MNTNPEIIFNYALYLFVFLISFIILRYTPLKFSNQYAFLISGSMVLIQMFINQINFSLDKYISIRNEEQCKNVCEITKKKETFENISVNNNDVSGQPHLPTNNQVESKSLQTANIMPVEKKDDEFITSGNKSMKNVELNNEYVTKQQNRKLEDNDIDYSDVDGNNLPVPKDYKYSADEYGYSFIPPPLWYNKPIRAPLCVIDKDKENIVSPVLAEGLPVDLKEFQSSLKITGPADINTQYIREKLNYK